MAGIRDGGSYSRDPKTGALTRRTEPAAQAVPTVDPVKKPAEPKTAATAKKES